MFNKNIYYILFIVLGLVYSQDPPLGFEYNQGTEQGFYFFQNITIDGQELDEDDWIGAFKKYDESQGGECTNDEINFDETLGGMCSSSNEGFICTPGFPDCNPDDCNTSIDVDNDGNLSVCACPDLNNGVVKFIGDPEKRIKEDYLRILRYYRFLTIYNSSIDNKTRKLIQKNADKIINLSSERIHQEFFKILSNDHTGKIINLMKDDGILDLVFSNSVNLKTYDRIIDIDNELFFDQDILIKFASLVPKKIQKIKDLKCFAFSNKEKKIIDLLINPNNEIKSYQSVKEVRAILYNFGIDNFTSLTRLYWAKDKKISNISQWRALLAMGQSWKAPKFPISAKDILLLGVPEGPLVGEILSEVEDWWIESDFIDDKASLFERIKAIVGAKI